MIATHKRIAPPLPAAVRTVDRWGLLAGVTGLLGNVLLVILFVTPAGGEYAWSGPANDAVGAVAILALIPVAAGLLTVCGNGPGLRAITAAAIPAMTGQAAVSVLFMAGLASFTAQVDSYYASMIVVFGWLLAASRAGRAGGRLPGQVARWGAALGAAGLAGTALLLASVPLPPGSLLHSLAYGAGYLAGVPIAAYPAWLIVLAGRLPGHLAGLAAGQPAARLAPS